MQNMQIPIRNTFKNDLLRNDLLANSLICSILDYCSILLINSTNQQLQQLNCIIKSTTRHIFNKRKYDTCSISSLVSFTDVLFKYFANRNPN